MGAGSLQSWNASILGPAGNPTYGGPYWNNQSGDGDNGNIGWCLTGSPACLIANPPGAICYFGNGTNAVSNMFFGNSIGSVQVSLLGNFTSQTGSPDGINYFGWYAIQPDGTLGSMATLWSSAAPVDTFAVFSPADNRFVLGMEDSTPGDLDFNDMIVQVATGVPEPASAVLAGGALAFCGLLATARRLPVNRRHSPIV